MRYNELQAKNEVFSRPY